MKTQTILIFALGVCALATGGAGPAENDSELRQLRAENEVLRAKVERLSNKVAELEQRNTGGPTDAKLRAAKRADTMPTAAWKRPIPAVLEVLGQQDTAGWSVLNFADHRAKFEAKIKKTPEIIGVGKVCAVYAKRESLVANVRLYPVELGVQSAKDRRAIEYQYTMAMPRENAAKLKIGDVLGFCGRPTIIPSLTPSHYILELKVKSIVSAKGIDDVATHTNPEANNWRDKIVAATESGERERLINEAMMIELKWRFFGPPAPKAGQETLHPAPTTAQANASGKAQQSEDPQGQKKQELIGTIDKLIVLIRSTSGGATLRERGKGLVETISLKSAAIGLSVSPIEYFSEQRGLAKALGFAIRHPASPDRSSQIVLVYVGDRFTDVGLSKDTRQEMIDALEAWKVIIAAHSPSKKSQPKRESGVVDPKLDERAESRPVPEGGGD